MSAGYAVSWSIPAETESFDPHILTINHFRPYLDYWVVASGLASLISGIWALARGSKAGWIPIVMLASCPFFCIGTFFHRLEHEAVSSVRDKDGSEYRLLQLGSLQGKDWWIGKVLSESALRTKYLILAEGLGDEDLPGYLSIVRPRPRAGLGRKLLLTHDAKLVALANQNTVFVAYDLRSRTAFADVASYEWVRDVRELSPFILLDGTSQPDLRDFESLLDPENPGRPRRSAIQRDLRHPNPAVREMARRLDRSLREHAPEGEE
jgi:hypothetical protein